MRIWCLFLLAIFNVLSIFLYFNVSSESVKAAMKSAFAVKGNRVNASVSTPLGVLENITARVHPKISPKPPPKPEKNKNVTKSRPPAPRKDPGKQQKAPKTKAIPTRSGKQIKSLNTTDGLFLTFDWNGGRVNNNVMALAGALTVASRLNPPRITIIHKTPSQTTYPNPDYALIGVFEGFWDLEALKEAGYLTLLDDIEPAPQIMELEPCMFSDRRRDYGGCQRVHLPVAFKWMQEEETRIESQPYVNNTIRTLLQPAPWIKEIANTLFKKKFPKGRPRISVHQRHHAWGHAEEHGSDFLCRGILKNMASDSGNSYRDAAEVWQPENAALRNELLNITEISCALTFPELQAILKYWKRPLFPKETFFLATDREREDSFKEMIENGAVVIEEAEIENLAAKHLPIIMRRLHKHNCEIHICPSKKRILALASVLVDTWAMTLGEFFVGGYYSTMSSTACYWRGVEKMHDSSLCFLPSRLRANSI